MIDCPDCGDPYPADQLDGHQIEDHPAHIVNVTLIEGTIEVGETITLYPATATVQPIEQPPNKWRIPTPDLARNERIMRWLEANGTTHTAGQIVGGSVWTDGATIHYDIWVGGIGRHHVVMRQTVDCHDANLEVSQP